MRILQKDAKHNKLKLLIETLDDLWQLYNLIEKDDLVLALTYRREDAVTDKLRPERSEKKKMVLGIRVKDIEFQEFTDTLRIKGVIEQGPQDLGSYHTLNLSVEDNLTIIKDWKEHHIERLSDAIHATKRPLILFVSMDYDEAMLVLMREYGLQKLASIDSGASGKMYKAKDVKKEYYGELLAKVKQYELPLLVIGPGFAKEEFLQFCREHGACKDASVVTAGHAGMLGVQEVLKRGADKHVLKDSRVARETAGVERLLTEISKDGLYAYGLAETEQALRRGAVETLLVTDELVRAKGADALLESAKGIGCSYMIISTLHEAGKKLRSLGGVGALLRYKVA